MVKIFSMSIIQTASSGSGTLLATANDLSSFSFYQRGSVGEFMTFFSNTVASRTGPGQRQSIQENNYTAHVYHDTEKLAAVVITDQEYPVRPAFSLLSKLLQDFAAKVPKALWDDPAKISFPELQSYLSRYQDPRQADAIMKVQAELDETKIVLHKTIESVLERGERLDTLVDRSNHLSAQSKVSSTSFRSVQRLTTSSMFYKSAKRASLSGLCRVCVLTKSPAKLVLRRDVR
ncbi:SNARE protein [Mycena kentingensis (nom. inval.)]|nr:SNARE protein [Mycena kentingensis (nom. inval.)]